MRIVMTSDTHGMHDMVRIPHGDILIHAGDFSGDDHTLADLAKFATWIEKQPHAHKILIAGNHDWIFERDHDLAKSICNVHGINYLQGDSCMIQDTLFWGSPVTPEFCNWAFNRKRGEEIRANWESIPRDTDVLITHGPPHNILDYNPADKFHCGCQDLRDHVQLIRPKLHVFGHIHAGYGWSQNEHTTFINASACDEHYSPSNSPQIFEL